MYGKLFTSMYDGTLVEDWRALITFQQLIILCDSDGVVDMTARAISSRTGIPIEHIEAGLEILEKEDKYSRTNKENGKRIVLIDGHRPWGWKIVNHKYYRDLASRTDKREKDRKRIAAKRAQVIDSKDMSQSVADSSDKSQMSPIQDTYTNTDKRKERGKKRFSPPSLDEVKGYISEKAFDVDPNNFIDFYTSKDWMIGKNKMKDWKAAVRTWAKRNGDKHEANKPMSESHIERQQQAARKYLES